MRDRLLNQQERINFLDPDEDTEENNGDRDYLAEANAPDGSQMTMQQCREACQMCDMCTCTFDDAILDSDGGNSAGGGDGGPDRLL